MAVRTIDRPESPLDALLAAPGFIDHPYPVYARLRDEHPLYWSRHWGVWVLSRYEDIAAVLRDPARFSSSGRFNSLIEMLPPDELAALAPIARFGEAAFNVDPPVHTRLRRILRAAFSTEVIDALRPRVEALIDQLLAQIAGRASRGEPIDLVRDLALPLPVVVVSELLGATNEERAPFEGWALAMLDMLAGGGAEQATARRAATAFEEMEAHFRGMLDARRREPRADLLTRLVDETAPDALTIDEAAPVAAEMMIAGHHTTKDLIANALLTLDRHRDARDAVQRDPSRLASAVEEVLRFEGPIQRGWRRVAEDVEIHGRTLRRGDLVFLLLGSANRDPSQFVEPDRFDIARSPNRHLAFGYGIHLCIGAPLARIEAPLALAALYARWPALAPVSPVADWYRSIHIRGPRTLLVSLGPEAGGRVPISAR